MSVLIKELRQARTVGVSLALVNTSDDFASLKDISENLTGKFPIIAYDCVRGFQPVNKPGELIYSQIVTGMNPVTGERGEQPELFIEPVTALSALLNEEKLTITDNGRKKQARVVVIVLGAQRILKDNPAVEQAISNLRDPFKRFGKLLVLLAEQGFRIPPSLSQDLFQIDDGVPDEETRRKIIEEVIAAAKPELEEVGINLPASVVDVALRSTRGLSAYATEQSVALSINKTNGFQPEVLKKRWIQTINAVPGLTVDMSGMSPEDIGGLNPIKDFAKAILNGKKPPSAVIRIEEIEKAIAGAGYANGGVGDTSGTSQEILGAILTFMQEEDCSGLVAIGPAGSGKSLCSTAIGSYGNIPTITLDLSALKGSLVGETGGNTRRALSTIKALAGKNTFWIASCNSASALPPELQRRFSFGRWFFDLPSAEERDSIWKIWLKKCPGVEDVRPDDAGWTGAEIRTACQTAYKLNITPKQAAEWVVPISKMVPEQLEGLRKSATGKYLSANTPGIYQYKPEISDPFTSNSARKISFKEDEQE